jgi:hypothetical protein
MRFGTSRRAYGALLTCACVVTMLATGCRADEEPGGQGLPPTTSSSGQPVTESVSPSPSWQGQFTPAQLADYEAALNRWSDYERDTEPIWAAGHVTDEARRLFQAYFVSPVWQKYLDRLTTYEGAGVTIEGLPTVFWSKAKRIATSNGEGSVSIVQCVDYSSQIATQAGQQIEPIQEPALREATLDRTAGNPWLLLRIDEPSVDSFKSCTEEGP